MSTLLDSEEKGNITMQNCGSKQKNKEFATSEEVKALTWKFNDKFGETFQELANIGEKNMPEEIQKQVEEILDKERWQGYVSGKVEGALNVLYSLDLDMEKRLELLQSAVGLSRETAEEFLKPREIKYRIYKHPDLSSDDKKALDVLMEIETMNSEKPMEHPKETLFFIARFGGDIGPRAEKFFSECLPQVDLWIEQGEEVSMKRVKDWIIEKYGLY